jgi:hypothetical protein
LVNGGLQTAHCFCQLREPTTPPPELVITVKGRDGLRYKLSVRFGAIRILQSPVCLDEENDLIPGEIEDADVGFRRLGLGECNPARQTA